MSSTRIAYLWLAVVSLLIGLAEPFAEIAWKCRAGFETTEACVWGKAYLPLARWLVPMIIGPIAFIVLTLLLLIWQRIRVR